MAEGTRIERVQDSRPGFRFPTGHHCHSVNLPCAESGVLGTHGRSRALVSSEARSLIGSLSIVRREGSNPHVRRHTLLRRARLPITPPALGVDDRLRPGDLGGATELRGHELGWAPRARTWNLSGQSRAGLPDSPTAHCEPLPGADPGCRPYKGQVDSRSKGRVVCARRESDPHGLGCPPWIRTTTARAQNAVSCQLDQWASSTGGGIRTRTSLPAHEGLSLAWLPVSPLPHVPPEARTPLASVPRAGLEPATY
jgi:hypothetical protein